MRIQETDYNSIQERNQEILTRGIKVEVLPTFDIKFLFLNIRAKSVGEVVGVEVDLS